MNIRLNCKCIQLSRRQYLTLSDSAGITVNCISGCVWITQHRDTRDIILGPNESFTLDRPGLAIIQALAECAFRLQEPVPVWRHLFKAMAHGAVSGTSNLGYVALFPTDEIGESSGGIRAIRE